MKGFNSKSGVWHFRFKGRTKATNCCGDSEQQLKEAIERYHEVEQFKQSALETEAVSLDTFTTVVGMLMPVTPTKS